MGSQAIDEDRLIFSDILYFNQNECLIYEDQYLNQYLSDNIYLMEADKYSFLFYIQLKIQPGEQIGEEIFTSAEKICLYA